MVVFLLTSLAKILAPVSVQGVLNLCLADRGASGTFVNLRSGVLFSANHKNRMHDHRLNFGTQKADGSNNLKSASKRKT